MRFSCFLVLVFFLGSTSVYSQQSYDLRSALETIEQTNNVRIFFQEEYLPNRQVQLDLNTENVESLLDQVLLNTGLGYLNYKDYVFVIAPQNRLDRTYDLVYFDSKKEDEQIDNVAEQIEIESVGSPDDLDPSGTVVLKGFITDDAIGDPIIGATILVVESGDGFVTNEIGQYEIPLGTGEYTLRINSIGFIERELKVKMFSSGDLDIKISKEAVQLDEIVVSATGLNENITRNEAGLEVLSAQEIKKLPAFLGEVDVVKSLLLLPGVSTVGEGSGGFNVRGGTVDQNLIMQDGMYLFNSSHVLGLFSLFNPDFVKGVNLYKGSMPAKYGGRLSSVLDVELKEGNYQKFTGKGGIGFVSSRLTLEAPISKGNSSIMFGGRASYSDWIFNVVNVADLRESSAFFL